MKKPFLAALVLFGFSTVTFGSDLSNLELFRLVSDQVNRYAYFTIFDTVDIEVDAGNVALSGRVTMPYKASEIEQRVARIDGVKTVTNTIAVLPASLSDDRLRRQIARAIYGHPALAKYGLGPDPSIHVIVELGRVTLNGVVNNDMHRTIATSVARPLSTFEFTNDLKTPAEIERELESL